MLLTELQKILKKDPQTIGRVSQKRELSRSPIKTKEKMGDYNRLRANTMFNRIKGIGDDGTVKKLSPKDMFATITSLFHGHKDVLKNNLDSAIDGLDPQKEDDWRYIKSSWNKMAHTDKAVNLYMWLNIMGNGDHKNVLGTGKGSVIFPKTTMFKALRKTMEENNVDSDGYKTLDKKQKDTPVDFMFRNNPLDEPFQEFRKQYEIRSNTKGFRNSELDPFGEKYGYHLDLKAQTPTIKFKETDLPWETYEKAFKELHSEFGQKDGYVYEEKYKKKAKELLNRIMDPLESYPETQRDDIENLINLLYGLGGHGVDETYLHEKRVGDLINKYILDESIPEKDRDYIRNLYGEKLKTVEKTAYESYLINFRTEDYL